MRQEASSNHIFVNTPLKVFTLKNVGTHLTIFQLKSKIEIASGIPVEYQDVLLSGQVLPDQCSLSEVGIRNGSIVRISFRKQTWVNLCKMVMQDDLSGILSTGVQSIDLSCASNDDEVRRLITWNKDAAQRLFLAICIAAANGMLELIVSLMQLNAMVINQVTSYNRSALHLAASSGSIGCVCILLDNGIDPHIRDLDNKTAEDLASENGHVHCKRRIWLYRWSITPIKRREISLCPDKAHSSWLINDRDENCSEKLRLPSLGQEAHQPSNTTDNLLSNGSNESEVGDGLPQVNQNNFEDAGEYRIITHSDLRFDALDVESSTTCIDKQENKQQENNSKMPKQIEDAHVENDLDMEANDRRTSRTESGTQTEEKGDADDTMTDEYAKLFELAEKYGYVISENPQLKKRKVPKTRDNEIIPMRRKLQRSTMPIPKASYVGFHGMNSMPVKNINRLDKSVRSVARLASASNAAQEKRYEKTDDERDEKNAGFNGSERKTKTENGPNISHRRETIELDQISDEDVPSEEIRGEKLEEIKMSGNDNEACEGKGEPDGTLPVDEKERASARNANISYDQWLERKKKEKVTLSPALSLPTMNKSDERREQGEQAFKKWLQTKKQRYRALSACSVKSTMSVNRRQHEEAYFKSGITFDSWMQQKKKNKPRSASLPGDLTQSIVKKAYSSGLTHEQWMESKKKRITRASSDMLHAKSERNRRMTGITFDNWMADKEKQRQIDEVQQATSLMRIEFEKEMEYQRRLTNPKIRTFEQWQLDKKYELQLKKAKEKKERHKSVHGRVKYEEDSKLVFDMWLLNKHLQEMQQEEKQLNDARELWERKRKELSKTIKTES